MSEGLNLPERVRESLARAVEERGVQARVVSTRRRDSMRPPTVHLIVAAPADRVEAVRGPARVARRLEFYRTPHGPVVRLALSIYPQDGEPLSAATLLNVAQVSGDTALAGLGRQERFHVHFYRAGGRELAYAFSKELSNAPRQRGEAREILHLARKSFRETPQESRSFRRAVAATAPRFKLPVPLPEEQG
ncbi:hypothetical protein Rxycam_02528 [Rubrobacter xylanophilus DSM 9941]|uniref:hypothetical protein n=1 Tax=Rubrobacter xylanophilus TaxID=49319 RepID=UPI001C63FFD9|nr:hypothetical protein [Rubrobacter xylanophilus]QYJ16693.1 hypothetical protein Rxycam_02528 [Rubrobacter xylanophilus DSM 9941]